MMTSSVQEPSSCRTRTMEISYGRQEVDSGCDQASSELTARAKAAHETLAEYEAAPHRDPTIRREVALAERLQHMHHHPKQGRSNSGRDA